MAMTDAQMDALLAKQAAARAATSQSAKLTEADAPAPIIDEQTKIQGARNALAAAATVPVAPTGLAAQAGLPSSQLTKLPTETNTQFLARTRAAKAEERAAAVVANPLLDKSNKPEAPAGYEYAWIGGTNTGQYQLYKLPPAGGGGGGGGKTVVSTEVDADGNTVITYSDGTKQIIPKAASTSTTTPTVTPGGSVNANPGALQIVTDALKAAGLGALSASAWAMWNKGYDFNAIMDDPTQGIRASAEYKKVFPAMAELNKMGEGITEGQYLDKVAADKELLKQYNMPPGIFDTPEYLGSLMTNHVNIVELQKRLIAIQDTVMSLDPSVTKYAKDVFGLDSGHLMAWAADPTMALPLIQQQAEAVKIGGAAFAAGIAAKDITQAEATSLANAGVTQAQAKQGFTNVAQMGQYSEMLPGANPAETVTTQDLINAQFATSPEAITKLQKAKQSKLAEYVQGGQFAATQGGVTGLGTAPAV
jgi:hypothetical protein